jgi:hypothetical protein
LDQRGEHTWAAAVATTYSLAWASAVAALSVMTIIYIGFLSAITDEDRKQLRLFLEKEKNLQTPDEREAERVGPRLARIVAFIACGAVSAQFFAEDQSSFFAGISRLIAILSGFLLFFAVFLAFRARQKAMSGTPSVPA